MTEKLTKLAVTSRLFLLALQLLANIALPDHKTEVFRAPWNETHVDAATATPAPQLTLLDRAIEVCLGGLRHWDSEYFLHIAEHEYSYENTLAFYPLYPMLIRALANSLRFMGVGLTMRSCALLVGVLINLFVFCKAVSLLYNLTQRIFNDPNKSWNAALLFCFNPASIFFSAAYSESVFFCVSLLLMLECVTELKFGRVTLALALSTVCRSNGLVNAGFPVYFIGRKVLLRSGKRFYAALKIILCLVVSLIPLTIFYFHAFQQFCVRETADPAKPTGEYTLKHLPAVRDYALAQKFVMAGSRQPENSPWCDQSIPYPYSYVQAHYWNVGFLRYYQWKQLPNFLLALPVLAFLLIHCYKYLRHFLYVLLPKYRLMELLKEYKSLPFVLHALFLTIFCTFFVHIQVATRLLCSASPCLYWFAADYLPKSFGQFRLRSWPGLILFWFGSYYIVGTIAFSNNLPWT